MANKSITLLANLSYVDAEGRNATLPQLTISPEYQAQTHGGFDLPEATAAGDFVIPFGSVAKATCVVVINQSGQPVDVSVNAGDLLYTALATGKSLLIALPMAPADAITAVTVTTGDVQAADGSVAFHVFGDPVFAP